MPNEACHDESQSARGFFVVAPYLEVEGGALSPPRLLRGPCESESGRPCRVVHHDRRTRKSGPQHRLVVLRCKTHHRSFTVYPPGYVPFARRPLVVVAPDGGQVAARASNGAARFDGSLFQAALDAAAGKSWHRAQPRDWTWSKAERRMIVGSTTLSREPAWSTQGRHLEFASRMLGLVGRSTDERVQLADLLGVDALLLHENRDPRGHRARGGAVMAVLEKIRGRSVEDRLCEAGFQAGLLPMTFRWDPSSERLLRMPFRGSTRRGGPFREADP